MTLRLAIGTVALLGVLAAGEAPAARLRVCAFSFHGPEELAVFESRLPASDFEILDLSPPPLLGEAPPPDPAGGRGWLRGVCRADLRCDVVLYSAEFAGRFFGRCGRSLTLQEMEEASCDPRCDGLFHTPREVFLLACNTLATKDEDLRTPAIYLQVLLDHGFDRASAERVVAMRYGPLGPTFREALRRIFMGVPRVYGFSSVAPLGQYSGPMLERYFGSVGDYRTHLERIERGGPNRALAAAFAGTSLVETSGLDPSEEEAAADRELICALYDERRTVAARLEIVRDLVARGDLLAFVPSIQVFIGRHPAEKMQPDERRVFDEIRANDAARERVLGLVHGLDVSALQLEIAHFALRMGWMTREQFRTLATDAAQQLLRRPLTNETVDVMCEVSRYESVGEHFSPDDLPAGLFHDPEGIRFVSCLATPGDEVSARLVAALGSDDPDVRLWAAHGLSRRVPLPEPLLLRIVPHLDDTPPGVRLRLAWILRAQLPLPDEVREAVEAADPKLAAELAAPERPRSSRVR